MIVIFILFVLVCCAVWHNGSHKSQVIAEISHHLQSLRLVR